MKYDNFYYIAAILIALALLAILILLADYNRAVKRFIARAEAIDKIGHTDVLKYLSKATNTTVLTVMYRKGRITVEFYAKYGRNRAASVEIPEGCTSEEVRIRVAKAIRNKL